jgi:putative GTP pyrophosphokinase
MRQENQCEVDVETIYAPNAKAAETVRAAGEADLEVCVEEMSSLEKPVEVEEQLIRVNELVPLHTAMSGNMERIADLTEQFSQTMDPVLRMYNAAMSATTARLEIIQDEFKYRKLRSPIHHIDTRLKSAKSILGKLEKKDLDLTLGAACNNIYDIAGIRVVCPYMKDVYLIKDRIMAQDDIHIMNVKDYIEEPKANGYRSLHMIIRVPVYFMNKKQMVPVELQIRTLAMDLWASLEHDIKYKSLYKEAQVDMDFEEELKECSRLIYEAEEKMERMNRALEL